MSDRLFTAYEMGGLKLKNRILMAPMTRCRASATGVPSELAIEYYSQRTSAGLIITEGSQISPMGVGYINTPGIYNRSQVEAWKKIVDAVHKQDGVIFLQLWHVGRMSHPDFHDGKLPIAPSALPFSADIFTPQGKKKTVIPRAMTKNDIKQTLDEFAKAAEYAKEANFDGVEIHGANGYLLDQFLRYSSNKREDEYGGTVENRMRFPLEVIKTITSYWDISRVGYRISPNNFVNGMLPDTEIESTFTAFTKRLNDIGIGYLHVFEFPEGHRYSDPEYPRLTQKLHEYFKGTYIVNGGYTQKLAEEVLTKGIADLIAFGTAFLANPDLPGRFKNNITLNTPIQETFYQGGAKGYIDYPASS